MALATVILASGLHLPLLQGFAWARMAWQDGETPSFAGALQKAMKTKDLCGICIYVDDRQAESSDTTPLYWHANLLLLLVAISTTLALYPPRRWQRLTSEAKPFPKAILDTSVPPPRAVGA